jgi:hypothetical protein
VKQYLLNSAAQISQEAQNMTIVSLRCWSFRSPEALAAAVEQIKELAQEHEATILVSTEEDLQEELDSESAILLAQQMLSQNTTFPDEVYSELITFQFR